VLGLRTSCPAATRNYSLRCIDSLVVRLVGADGQPFRRQCTAITQPYDSMQALVSSTNVVEVLKDVRARSDVRLELRAYHGTEGVAPCDLALLDDAHLMFWGMSAVTDFTDQSRDEVTVEIECRPECDCDDLVDAAQRCPPEMLGGVCAPPANRLCRKECESADNCWGGSLSCEIGTCEAGVSGTVKCCAPVAGRICSPCAYDSECESGLCVHNTTAGVDEWFCADPCPPLPDVTPCPTDMSCKRLGNGVYERAPASP
jgi:hypothetical protein